MVQQALEFCGQYTREHEQTQAFSKALVDNGLLVERNATVRLPDGREFNLNGFLVVDVESSWRCRKQPWSSGTAVAGWH